MCKTANGVRYTYSESGAIRMINPKTINRYHELKAEQPKSENYGVFFAFSEEQFEKGRKSLVSRGYLKEGEKVCSAGMGMYGTQSEIERYLDFYAERSKKITAECDPQEVYFYEWNNHECMISYDDDEVVKIIIGYFGKDAAHKLHRVGGGTPTNVLAPLTERDRHLGEYRDALNMLGRLAYDCYNFFSTGSCCYHRPTDLWGGCVKREIEEMRKLYSHLPDDIKDASPMTKDELDGYCKSMEEWADEEFSKPEYDPVPRTKRKDFPKEILLDEALYYWDDENNLKKADHVWFSCDTRRFHQDERKQHGYAFTSYMGKHGTTLVSVRPLSYHKWQYYRRPDLCDVSCKVVKDGWRTKLVDFHYE